MASSPQYGMRGSERRQHLSSQLGNRTITTSDAVYDTPEARGCASHLLGAVHMQCYIHGKGVHERGRYDGHDQLQEELSHVDWCVSQAAYSKHKQSLVPQVGYRIVDESYHNYSGV